MKFQFYLEKLFVSPSFQEFITENKEAFPCSCFFAIDKEGMDNKQHMDFFVPSTKKTFSFKLEEKCEMIPLEMIYEKIPEKLSMNYDFDFKEIEKMILEEMERKQIKNKIQKLLFSIQKINGKEFLIGTIFISGLALLKVNIEIAEKRITEFEKASFFEMVKIIKKGD